MYNLDINTHTHTYIKNVKNDLDQIQPSIYNKYLCAQVFIIIRFTTKTH